MVDWRRAYDLANEELALALETVELLEGRVGELETVLSDMAKDAVHPDGARLTFMPAEVWKEFL